MKELWKKIHSDTRLAAVFYGAIGSLLASAIIKYTPLLLSWLGGNAFGLLTKFIDSRYAKAATLETTNYSYFLLVLIFVLIVVAWVEISGTIKRDLGAPVKEEKKKTKEPNKETPKWVSKYFLGVRIFIWFYLAWGLLYIAGESMVLNAVTDFKQHVRIVSPYIDPKEKDMLVSEWSQMRSLDDYNGVYKKMIEISEEHELTLYRNGIY
jgi:hypothetical protein